MLILPTEFAGFVERPHQDEPWLWLWELVLDEPAPPSAPTHARLTPYPQEIEWPPGSGKIYYPTPMRHSPIEQSGEGQLPSIEITIDNTQRFLMRHLETFEWDGKRATLTLVNRKSLATVPNAFLRWDFIIQSAVANRQSVGIRLEMPNFFERRVPNDRFNASRCRWIEFGGPECGYVINSAAAFKTCPRTLDACVQRGEDELNRGLPVLHPQRYGGFPGIPVQRNA